MKKGLFFGILFSASVGMAGTYYVSLSGNHTSPFSNWATAATNIQAAIDLATTSGDEVLVADGHYSLDAPLTINSAITVRGYNGPSAVTIDGQGLRRCFELDDVSCSLSGLTITNGFSTGDGGCINANASVQPAITNCVISGGQAMRGGGLQGGSVYRSYIHNNAASSQGGGTYFSNVYNSLIYSNRVSGTTENDYGGGVEGGALYNCTVVKNHAHDTGGVDNCVIHNSIIYSNSATLNADVAYSQTYDSCFLSGIGNFSSGAWIEDDPLFQDFAADNFRLAPSSPCKNVGMEWYASLIDLDGNPRVVATIDMGAYEIQVTPEDMDGDGMADDWEALYFGHYTNGFPMVHSDSDVFNNLAEYIAGTDPTDGTSYFAITNWGVGSFRVEWPAVSNRVYSVYRTGSLSNAPVEIATGLEWPVNAYTDTVYAAESEGFYRVKVRLNL